MPNPNDHLFHVELDVPRERVGALDVALPAWTPGSYMIRDFARHVQDFEATDARGRALAWERVDKQTWRIDAGSARRVRVRYRVYANDLSVQTSHLDATHGFANGTNLFLYIVGEKERPAKLVVKPPRGWHVDCALPEDGRNAFAASDYDALVDAPLEIGTHRRLDFTVRGKKHRIALYGRGNEDAERIRKDLRRIVEEEAAIFGELPYERYVFIIHLTEKPRGGLEHRGSNVSAVDRWTFQPGKKYENFLSLEAHEFFHTWNVKRIRPAVLGPFDYAREVHTTLLWAMEGITSYYDHLVLVRAGLMSEERYREYVGETITDLRKQPGRFKLSLAESSKLAWVKLYKRDENWVNTGVSYYHKGELIGLVLDLAIRERTKGKRSLDDVMRALYRKYPADGPGIPERLGGEGVDGWRETLEEVTGLSWRAWFRRHIEGTAEVDFERALRAVGWDLSSVKLGETTDAKEKKPKAHGDYAGPGGWLGVKTKLVDGRLRVAHVLSGSPAMEAGINADDELVALDALQLKDKDDLDKRLREREAGARVSVHVFRRGELVATEATLAEAPPEKWIVKEKKTANAVATRRRQAWLAPRARN